MLNKSKKIEKLRKQVAQYERKGYKNTAAHIMLAKLLVDNPVDGVPVRNAKKAVQEKITNGE